MISHLFIRSLFISKQPNEQTLSKQLDIWYDLIISHYSLNKLFVFSLKDLKNTLFNNSKISRCVSSDFAIEIIVYIINKKKAMWVEKDKECIILWKSIEDWSSELYNHALENGFFSIMTFYELRTNLIYLPSSFVNIPSSFLRTIINHLQTLKKVKTTTSVNEDELGVKFIEI